MALAVNLCCKDHPRYTGELRPASPCTTCEIIHEIAQVVATGKDYPLIQKLTQFRRIQA